MSLLGTGKRAETMSASKLTAMAGSLFAPLDMIELSQLLNYKICT